LLEYFIFKIDQAKNRVLLKRGMSASSFRKRPLQRGGLVGNKVLIDGYNNNFRDHLHSFERHRAKYKFFYFYDEAEKYKLGYPELYFRTVGLVKPAKPQKQQQQQQQITNRPIIERETPNSLPIWKKAVNTIFYLKTIKKYADILESLGVEIDLSNTHIIDTLEERTRNAKNKRVRKPPTEYSRRLKIASKIQANISDKERQINLLKRALTAMQPRNSTLPLIKRKQRPITDRSRIGSSFLRNTTSSRISSTSIVSSSNSSRVTSAATGTGTGTGTTSVTSMLLTKEKEKEKEQQELEDAIEWRKNDIIRAETLYLYQQDYSEGMSRLETAKKIVDDASTFKEKTWLQQIYLGNEMVKSNVKRRIEKRSIEKLERIQLKNDFLNSMAKLAINPPPKIEISNQKTIKLSTK
jgi:hypothetical protein